jgi:hypothetical protein
MGFVPHQRHWKSLTISSAADAAQVQFDIADQGLLAKNARTPGYLLSRRYRGAWAFALL